MRRLQEAELKIRRDTFPLPRINKCLDALTVVEFFSTIDLASRYHQVAVHERDRGQTAFTTPFGLYAYLRMPFGLCNTPAKFQCLMKATLSDLVFQIMLIYLDDLLVFSPTFQGHLLRLEAVLKWLRKTGLKVKMGFMLFISCNRGIKDNKNYFICVWSLHFWTRPHLHLLMLLGQN